MVDSTNNKWFPMAIIVIIAVVIGFFVLNRPDQRTTVQKVGDAVNELPSGIDKAARQLEDRTPADKLNDAAKDTKEDVKKSLNYQ